MSEHTFGSLLYVTDKYGDRHIRSGRESIMSDTKYYPWVPDDERYWHLFAAAPDLLEALRAVLRVADRKTEEFDMARAAISKAEGKE